MPLDRHPIGSKIVEKDIPRLQEESFVQQGPGTTHLEKRQQPLTYIVWGRPEIATGDDRVASR
jgi:hypothetical protein